MPNMTMPSRVLTHAVFTTLKGPGNSSASAATTMTMAAMYLPTKSLTFSNAFMINSPFSRTLIFADAKAMKHPENGFPANKNAFVPYGS